MFIVVVIPCYNEAKRLNVREFEDFLNTNDNVVFCFVNDGSSDETGSILERFAQKPNSCVLTLEKNSGKAEAVRQGILCVYENYPEADFIGFWDADLAAPLDEIFHLSSQITDDTLIALGCRHLRLGTNIKRSIFRHYLGRVFATAASFHLNLSVYDTQCGSKLFRKYLIPDLFSRKFVTKWFFDVEILRRAVTIFGKERVEKSVIEVPLNTWVEPGGSKVNLFRCVLDFIRLLSSKD